MTSAGGGLLRFNPYAKTSEIAKPSDTLDGSAAANSKDLTSHTLNKKADKIEGEKPISKSHLQTQVMIKECAELTCELAEYDDLNLPGARKFHNKLVKERQFLEKALATSASEEILYRKINTSNINYLRGVMWKLKEELASTEGEVVGLFRKFLSSNTKKPKKRKTKSDRFAEIEVDIVANGGKKWIKVKAQKPESIQHDIIAKEKARTVVALARALAHHASLKPIHFSPPECVLYFASGVTPDVRKLVEDEGVKTEGETVESSWSLFEENSDESYSDEAECKITVATEAQKITAVNLDTTTLITYISDLTNGGGREFDSESLQMMALDEVENPALPAIMRHLEGRSWIVCETAVQSLKSLVEILAGEREKARVEELLERVKIVPDQRSSYIDKVKCRKLSEKNKIIFGTGHTLRIPTVTSNGKLIRSVLSLGVDLYVLTHPARPLTEKKSMEKQSKKAAESGCLSTGGIKATV